jgi:hypothetical protein
MLRRTTAWFVCTRSGTFFTVTMVFGRAVLAGQDDSTTALPRYKLEVGQQLTYEDSRAYSDDDGSKDQTNDQWQITVVGRNEDGSHRLLIHFTTMATNTTTEGKEQKQPERTNLGLADIEDLGNIVERFDSFNFRLRPATVLPTLPPNQTQLAGDWQSTGSFGSTLHYHCWLMRNRQPMCGCWNAL